MSESRKTTIIVVAVIAVAVAIFSGWRTLAGQSAAATDRQNSTVGRISPMSSMLGPNASGKPQTEMPPGGPPQTAQPQGGANQAGMMMGRPGGGAPMSHMPGGR